MKSFLSGLLLLLLLSSGLAGCTFPSENASAIRIRWSGDPQTLDPLLATTPQATEVLNLLHCSLMAGNPAKRRFEPWLAASFPQISRRGAQTLLTYELRPEARWDNGQPVLAQDVAFTLKVYNCPGLPTEYAQTQYGFFSDVELDSLNPRRFTLVSQSASSEVLVASGDYAILPEYALDPQHQLRPVPLSLLHTDSAAAVRRFPALKAFAQHYIRRDFGHNPARLPGCGPYKLVSWKRGRSLQLQRKTNWWADKLTQAPPWLQAHAAALDYQIIPDNTTAVLAVRRGNVDLYPMPPARDFNQLRRSADTTKLAFATSDSYYMTVAGFNTQAPLLQDAATRRALRLLFDVPGIMQATQPGLSFRSASLITPHDSLAYNDSLPLPPFSPKEAAALLQQAGWQRRPNGWWRGKTGPLRLSMSFSAGETDQETAALQFRAAAAQLGIPVQLKRVEAALFREELASGGVEGFIRAMSGNPFSYNFKPVLHSEGIGLSNYSRFSSLRTDQLIDAIAATSDPEQRRRLLRRLQAVIYQEAPLTVLYFTSHRLIASRRLRPVKSIRIRPGYDVLSLELAPSQTK